MNLRKQIEPCLYNWLGYGNLNGPYWFIGIEEGGAEIWKNQTLSLEESLKSRSNFELAMDFKEVWEDLYHIPMHTNFKTPTIWRYVAAYLLAFQGIEPGLHRDKVKNFMKQELGRKSGSHFLCELMPLPKKEANSIQPYESVWPDVPSYRKEVENARFMLIKKTLLANPDVQVIISYNQNMSQLFLNHFKHQITSQENWQIESKRKFQLSKIQIAEQRSLYFLSTPFFGNSHISYQAVWESSQRLQSILSKATK